MNCARCHNLLNAEEARELAGQRLCEDCYLDAVSTVRTCDPWAVHTARSLKDQDGKHYLTPVQQQFYDLVKARGEVPVPEAARSLGLTEEELRREFAPLRHMELLRAGKKDQLIFITLF